MSLKPWCLLAATGLLASGHPAAADDIRVVVSGGMTPAFKELVPVFEKLTSHRVTMEPGPSLGTTVNAIPVRLDRGESIDVLVMVRDGIPPLIAKGQVDPASVTDLARSKIAMAVRKGAPAPDISTVAAFRRALLSAKSVAWSDSASGVYLRTELFKRLGIDKELTAKGRTIQATPVGEAVASGEFELGFQQYSELLAVSGIQIVGLIPEELQKITMYSAAIPTGAKSAAAGRALIGFLASASAAGAIKTSGLEPLTAAVAQSKAGDCAALAGVQIPASALSLPTQGANVTAATESRQDATGTPVAFCKVTGLIKPMDPAAPSIGFEVDLPAQWNGKALQYGGGGYNGIVPRIASWPTHGRRTGATPLGEGYITLGSDSGHQARDANDASFAMNDEALANFGGLHIRKTRDVAAAVAKLHYGSAPRRFYFVGGSTGGREALTAALRWPEAYDGVIANYPTANFLGLRLWGAALARAIYDDKSAGWIPPAMVQRIASESLAECDGLDGAADGVVSNMPACRAGAAARLARWTCKAGPAVDCLTKVQVERTIKVYHEGFKTGWPAYGSVAQFGGYNSLEAVEMQVGSQAALLEPVASGPNAHHAARADQFMKYFVTRNPQYRLLDFDVQKPGQWQPQLRAVADAVGAMSTDYAAFVRRGGKVLWVQGQDDASVSPYDNLRLYQAVAQHMGQKETDRFMRFYLVPGLGHGIGSFLLSWDNVDILDRWVEQGTPPPDAPVAIDANPASKARSRPLCAWPRWPKYLGSGSLDDAASFGCVN